MKSLCMHVCLFYICAGINSVDSTVKDIYIYAFVYENLIIRR